MKKALQIVLQTATLVLPVGMYLFFMALFGNVKHDYYIKNRQETHQMVYYNDSLFIYDTKGDTEFVSGKMTYNENVGVYGYEIQVDEIVKINGSLFVSEIKGDNLVLTQRKFTEINKKESYKFSTSFIVSIVGVGIVGLIVSGKMQWQKKYPMIATLVALITGTGILYLIDTIVGSLFNVFLIFTISFALFAAEKYLFNIKKTDKDINTKRQRELLELENELEALKRAVGQ